MYIPYNTFTGIVSQILFNKSETRLGHRDMRLRVEIKL